MEVLMPYGKNIIKVEAPEEAEVVHGTYLPPLPDGYRSIQEAIRNPIGTASLEELAKDRKSAVIVINDVTRPAPSGLMGETWDGMSLV